MAGHGLAQAVNPDVHDDGFWICVSNRTEKIAAWGYYLYMDTQHAVSDTPEAVLAEIGTANQMSKPREEIIMNKDQVEGKLKEVGGKIQEAAGKVIGSEEQQAKGLANQAEGKVQKKVGDVKDAVETVTRKP